jgi:phosphatidylserine decarboxylase
VTQVYDRAAGRLIDEPQFGESGLRLLYGNSWMRPITNALISQPWLSRLATWPERRPHSAQRIDAFVQRYGVDLEDYPTRPYRSFADFFSRDFRASARPIDQAPGRLIAPADSRLTAYPVTGSLTVAIKGFSYTISELLGRDNPGAPPVPSHCLVFRLTVADCHRYCFIDDCTVTGSYELPGKLHTVGSWSDGRARVLAENHRVVTQLDTAHFGQVTVIEVGALFVGRIINHRLTSAARGQEKGYFAYGGSTIVLLLDGVDLDADIAQQSRVGVATKVRRGSGIGDRR